MVRLVLFDIDGTLILSGGAGEKAFGRVCETEFGVADGSTRLNFAGRTDLSIIRDFFVMNQIEATPENFQRFLSRYLLHLQKLIVQLQGRVLPGVLEMIREINALPQPPLVGLLTGNIRPGAQIKLTHYKLWDSFRMGAFADDHEDRNQIAVIARERGNRELGRELDGEEIIVIGDTPRDIECAKAIKARSLAVATGKYSLKELGEHQPTWSAVSLKGITVNELCR